MKIVETHEEHHKFLWEWNNHPSIIIPVWEDLERHPQNNSVAFLYVLCRTHWILPINHVDCQNGIFELSASKEPKWIWDKKSFLQSDIKINNLYDIQTYRYFKHNELLTFDAADQPFISHYHKLGIRDDLGKIVPIVKWGEWLNEFVNGIKHKLLFEQNWIDKHMLPVLADIERYGVCVDIDKFRERFPKSDKLIKGGRVYTQYNPYTITSRPSNRFGGINFSALNKSDGTRDVFIPKNGSIFVQMDYDAYHIRIIGKLINATLPKTSAHQWLANQYGLSYDDAKALTFRTLYGGVPEELTDIPYFRDVSTYINQLWSTTLEKGEVRLKHRKIPLEWIEEPNPQKVFNYLLQGLETEINIGRIQKVLKCIENTDIELNLYTYDSFLFSYPINNSTEKVIELKRILEDDGFPIRVTWGTDYGKV